MPYSSHPSLPYADFRQACRAFRPSELIPAIAAASTALGEPPYSDKVKQAWPAWGLAAAARDSLLYGNEHRHGTVDQAALRSLMRKFNIAADLPDSAVGTPTFMVDVMTRFTHEQFPWQESIFDEISRSHAWLVEGLAEVSTQVVNEASLSAMLGGMPLREAIGATFFLQVGANVNRGTLDLGWLDQPNFVEVLKLYPRSNIESILARLTTTIPAFRDAYSANAVGGRVFERFDYNPLGATPFVDLGADGPLIAPAPRLILRTVTPGGLYYAGMAAHGQDFANDLGHLFEHYIGRQFRLIESAEIHPEVVYDLSKKEKNLKSADWFVVLPDLVVVVEVKSKRLGPAARAGGPELFDVLADSLTKARKQIEKTLELIDGGHPAFDHIPTDRPFLGVIVTAEPFYTGIAYLTDHDVPFVAAGGLGDVPMAVASARDIEALVTYGDDAARLITERMAARPHGVVALSNLGPNSGRDNPILRAAYDSYPWPEGLASEGTD